MIMEKTSLTPNALAFIGLCNEYCATIENARETERDEFVESMLRLLPRLYITANDLKLPDDADEDSYIDDVLDDETYESVRGDIESLLGYDDSYLEVFEENMKYSDTPIGASIAEGLTDIFQVLYNFLELVKTSTEPIIQLALQAVKEDFAQYWSQTLCNVLRAVNNIRYNSTDI